jgi:hypothetical protein
MVDNGRPVKHVTVGVKLGVGVFVVLLSLFACNLAKAVSSTSLEWNPNADPSVAGYNVYYGGASRTYTNVINAGNSTNAVIDGLVEGKTYYFAVTAYTDDGAESDYSDEYIYIVPGFLTLTPGGRRVYPCKFGLRWRLAIGMSCNSPLIWSTGLRSGRCWESTMSG